MAAPASGAHTVPGAKRAPVVVLDRDARTRAAVAAALGGFDVHEAETLSTGGTMVNALRPRAVVCGLEFDPLELRFFALWVRAMFRRSIALVMLTPHGDARQVVRALQLGACACVEVPIDPTRLRRVMAKHRVIAPKRSSGAYGSVRPNA